LLLAGVVSLARGHSRKEKKVFFCPAENLDAMGKTIDLGTLFRQILDGYYKNKKTSYSIQQG
jgi:hypothetical protein